MEWMKKETQCGLGGTMKGRCEMCCEHPGLGLGTWPPFCVAIIRFFDLFAFHLHSLNETLLCVYSPFHLSDAWSLSLLTLSPFQEVRNEDNCLEHFNLNISLGNSAECWPCVLEHVTPPVTAFHLMVFHPEQHIPRLDSFIALCLLDQRQCFQFAHFQ